MKKTILHIINRDKFTSGYINYMKMEMDDWEHFFVTGKEGFSLSLCDNEGILFYENTSELQKNPQIADKIVTADKIIVSGVFNRGIIKQIPDAMIRKTYFQFWGGDFYHYRNKNADVKELLKRRFVFRAFRNCAGLVFLINGEYEEFNRITGVSNKHYVAPMPSDPMNKVNFSLYRGNERKDGEKVRIIVGNSATPENQHLEVFEMLAKHLDKNFEVVCPLSYGNKEYGETVIEQGRRILGNKFLPIVDFMEMDKYVELLSTCDIGVFNNNRQQAMGNINLLLALGKKVYIRENTSMWECFTNDFKVFQVSELNGSWNEIVSFSDEDRNHNIEFNAYDSKKALETEKAQWKNVLSTPI